MSKTDDKTDAKYRGRRGGGDRRGIWLRIVAPLVKIFLLITTRRSWSGMRNVPLTGGVILACNHVSQADPMVVAHYVYNSGRKPRFLAKASVFKIPVLGKLIKATGQIPVYRGGSDAAKSLYEAIEAVNEGTPVIFYPEGTTSKEPNHWPMRGRTGVARLVMETGAPVIPMTVWGPQDSYDPVRKKHGKWWRAPVVVTAGEPVDLSRWTDGEDTSESLTAMSDEIMLRIRNQLAAIRDEDPPPLYDMNNQPPNPTREDS